jgi:formylglycine-generating enzyme required for sulfatase activity
MKKKVIFVILLAFIFNHSLASASNRVALVIGNGSYQSAPLKNPVNDARDIARALKKLGFDVIEKTNVNKQELELAIEIFYNRLRSSKTGLFYYAGHGLQIRGQNYLIPTGIDINSESDVRYKAVDAGWILGKMEDAGNDLNLVILDACRDNPFARSFRNQTKGLAKMDAPKGSIIAYSTSPSELAMDGEGRNSPYTKAILTHINKSKQPVELFFKSVRKSVDEITSGKQTPWESTSLLGEFYFNPEQGKKESTAEPLLLVESQRSDKSSLFVNTTPEDAKIRILNIKPKFFQGMELLPGKYYIEVSNKEHVTSKQWISINQGEQKTIDVVLNPLQEEQKPVDTNQRLSTQKGTEKGSTALERLLAQAKLEKQQQEQKLNHEKARKNELKRKISIYEDLVKNYGNKYKEQAWKALCSDFPLLTAGLKSDDISALRQAASLYTAGDVWTDPATGMEFVFVPGGCFQMGSNSGYSDEKPVHEVCLNGYWIGKYEVTQGQWQKIMGSNPSKFKSGKDYPVETVSGDDAQQYISKLKQLSGNSFSLPTEAQWEYAARSGGKNQTYAGGNDVDRVAWYGSNSGSKTHRVGTKASNGLGIYDMSGNVWEWCEDVYDKNAYSKHSRNNPLVASGSNSRVSRGGSWSCTPGSVRAAIRNRNPADYRYDYLGFRLCLSRVR